MMTDIECVFWGSEDFGEVRDEGGRKEGVRQNPRFLAWTLVRNAMLC